MNIVRKVDGVELTFELTPDELFRAYEEQQRVYDIEDAKSYLCVDDPNELEWLANRYGLKPEDIADEKVIEEIAEESRRNQDKSAMRPDYALEEATRTVLRRLALSNMPTRRKQNG